MGKMVQKNAPIKYAEIIEGLSSGSEEEEGTEYVGPVLPQAADFFDLTVFESEERDKMITLFIERRTQAAASAVEPE